MPKTKEQIKKEMKQNQDREEAKKYLEEIKALDTKYKLTFQPIIKHLQDGSIVPSMQIVRLPEEVTIDKNAN